MKKYSFLIILSLWLYSCNDLLITTQHKAPVFEVSNSTIPADGNAGQKVVLRFHRRLSGDQRVILKTSKGLLVNLENLAHSTGSETLSVFPKKDKFSFLLVAGKEPSKNVSVNVLLNNHTASHNFEFKRVCPDDIQLNLTSSEYLTGGANTIEGNINLLNSSGPFSDNTRIDLKLSSDSLLFIENKTLYHTGSPVALTMKTLGKKGTATLTAAINHPECPNISISETIKLSN